MGKRKLSKAARFERMFRIWEYLRINTDSGHPTTQAKMRQSPEVAEFIGDKETFNRLIKDMARALNSDEFGYKEEKDWKIFFRDFQKYYGDHAGEYDEESDLDSTEEDDEEDDPVMYIDGLYYNRTFSYDEINRIIEGILATRTLDTKSAAKLIEKVERHLTTKFYQKGPKQICKVMEPELADRELLRNNLLTIQKAIDRNVQISFRFNGYTSHKKLEPIREKKDTVSPYYIVASGGRYYLLACKEVTINGEAVKNMSIWRIDLMSEVEIPGINEAFGIKGLRRIPKEEVKNLPPEWTEDFQLKHMNMSYDKPVWITLKIKSPKKEGDTAKSIRADYTFLHDWFGDRFKYIGTEKTAPYDDIVKVECSPFAMANWALQYSDRVEVVEPEEVRERVVEKIRNLNEKYGVEGMHMSKLDHYLDHHIKKNHEKETFKEKYQQYLESGNPGGYCPYKDIDAVETKDTDFYGNLAKFLNKTLGTNEFIAPSMTAYPFAIAHKDMYLTSDQFGFSVPRNEGEGKKLVAWDRSKSYPYVRYLSRVCEDDSDREAFVAECIYETRTIGGSFIWPKVKGSRWDSQYNKDRGIGNYIEDRVDLTLYEIKCFYEVHSEFYKAYSESGKNLEDIKTEYEEFKKYKVKDEARYSTVILLKNMQGKEGEALYRWLKIFGTFENYVDKLKFEPFVTKKEGQYLIRDMADKTLSVLEREKIKPIKEMKREELYIILNNVKNCTMARSEAIKKLLNEGQE